MRAAQIKEPGAGYTGPSLTNNHQPQSKYNPRFRDSQERWQRYECLKQYYCGQATTAVEFDRALRRARREAGV